MSEKYSEIPKNPEASFVSGERIATASRVLGYDITLVNESIASGEPYSERYAIFRGIENKIETMRTARRSAAAAMGIEVSEDVIQAWQPNEKELQYLQQELHIERSRMQMMDGVRAFITDERRMANLWKHQRDALRAISQFMEHAPPTTSEGGKTGYIDMPTGTGKTRTFGALVDATRAVDCLVLAPTRPILKQTTGNMLAPKNQRTGFAKYPGIPFSRYHHSDKSLTAKTVMTNASFNILIGDDELPYFPLVVVDEHHTGARRKYQSQPAEGKPQCLGNWFLGHARLSRRKAQSPSVAAQYFYTQTSDSHQNGLLAPVKSELRSVNIDVDEASLPEDRRERKKAIDIAYFDACVNDCLKDIVNAVRNGRGVLVRCPPGGDIWFAKRLATRLQQIPITTRDGSYRGRIRATEIGGSEQKSNEVDILLQGFRDNKVHVFCYVNLINMGVDLPNAKDYYNLDASTSRVETVQGMGRVLRLQFDERKKPIQAKIVDYDRPDMPNQYTCNDGLELKPGHVSLGWEFDYEEKVPVPFDTIEVPEHTADASVVGEVAIAHNVEVVYEAAAPDSEEQIVPERLDVPERLTIKEATAWFGLRHQQQFTRYLKTLYPPENLPTILGHDELVILEELFPDLAIPPLPEEEGYILLDEAAQQLGYRDGGQALAREFNKLGVYIQKFRHNGVVSQYIAEDLL